LLEETGCVGEGTAWWPRPVTVVDDAGALVGGAPVYARGDSQGEYIFDHAWADGSLRAEIPYYPKVTVAVPFTPASGARLLAADSEAAAAVRAGIDAVERAIGASGTHVLFCSEAEALRWAEQGFLHRHSVQFHWNNSGYSTFDDFLAALDHKRRKEIRRERRRCADHGLRIELRVGDDVRSSDWQALWRFYSATHAARPWQQRYLNAAWFEHAGSRIGSRAVTAIAWDGERPVGGSLSFVKGDTLYGRYWGAVADIDGLHFELCYYRLIEFAIAQGLRLFEAGAQGEHKLRRGFLPVLTHSAHRLVHPGLHEAVGRFIEDEKRSLDRALVRWGSPP
jgi:predicted N-acyltransferase